MSLGSASTCLPGKSGVRPGGNPDNFCLQNFLPKPKDSKRHPLPKAPTSWYILYIAVRKFYMALKFRAQAISFTVHSEMRPPWQTAFFRWSLRKICRIVIVLAAGNDLEVWQLAVFSQPLLISCAKGPCSRKSATNFEDRHSLVCAQDQMVKLWSVKLYVDFGCALCKNMNHILGFLSCQVQPGTARENDKLPG